MLKEKFNWPFSRLVLTESFRYREDDNNHPFNKICKMEDEYGYDGNQLIDIMDDHESLSTIPIYFHNHLYNCFFPLYYIDKCYLGLPQH